jgi:hypothetical protein
MHYAVEVERGNGEYCHCHRRTSNEIEEFDTLEEAQRFIAQVEVDRTKKRRDVQVVDLYMVGEHLDIESDAIKALKKEMGV